MSVDEARRLLLHDVAREAWGAEAALVLMEMLPPTGWADVATKHDLEELEARLDAGLGSQIDSVETRLGSRIASVETRLGSRIDSLEARLGGRIDSLEGQMEILRFEVRTAIADGQRRSIQWNVATIIAAVGLVLAAARLG